MDNNAANFLTNIFKNAEGLIKALETGEGFNLPEDKKEEFKKKFSEAGGDKMKRDLKKEMQKAKDLLKTMNYGKENKTNKE